MTASESQLCEGSQVTFGPFRLCLQQRVLLRGDIPVRLGSRARDILLALVERRGEVVKKSELIARTWPNTIVEGGALRVHIAAIRKALGDGHAGMRYVENVTGLGYRFVAKVTRIDSARTGALLAAGAESSGADGVRSRVVPALPNPVTRIVGREEAVADVLGQLMSERFLTIVGPGGIGKTTVALSVAHALEQQFSGEVTFFELGSISSPDLLASTLASSIGLAVSSENAMACVLAFIRGKKIVLVLDSCEHVIEAIAPLAERILSESPAAYVLATSREPLRAQGECVYPLPALRCPPADVDLSAAEALTYSAVQLFVERASAAGPRFELNDADARVVAAMCRKLDGIALAIELAASRVSALGIGGVSNLLESRLSILHNSRRTAVPRHRTLEALLDWSYKLLTGSEQAALRRLSIFVGSFTLSSAESLLPDMSDVVSTVASLVDKSMVSAAAHASPVQYRLLEATRSYALTKLAEDGELDQIARRHARYFATSIAAEPRRGSSDTLTQHLGNIRAALEWSFGARGDLQIGIDLVLAVSPVLLRLSPAECQRWCQRALDALSEQAKGTTCEVDLLESLAVSTMFTQGNDHTVRVALQRALDLIRSIGNPAREMDLLAGLNIFLTRVGDFRGALQVAKDSAVLARAARDCNRIAVAEWMFGATHHLIGNQAAAQMHCEAGFANEGLPSGRRTGSGGYDPRIRALVVLARTLWLRGFPERARRVAFEAIGEAETLGQPVTACIALAYTANVFVWLGDLTTANQIIGRLTEQAQRYSLAPYHAVGRGLLGELHILRGEYGAGADLLLEALDNLGADQHCLHVPEFCTYLARAVASRAQHERALELIEKAMEQRARSGTSFDMPEILRVKGTILLSSAPVALTTGLSQYARALELAETQSSLSWALRAATASLQAQPEDATARATLAGIYERCTEGFDMPDVALARRVLDDGG